MKTTITKFLAGLALAFALSISATAQTTPTKVVAGSTITFSVTADGTAPFTYTWQKAPAGSTAFVTISNAISSSYVIASAVPTDTGNYRVIVANDAGAVNSDTATISAATPPKITSFGVVVTPPATQ